jgi:hypothetical protein
MCLVELLSTRAMLLEAREVEGEAVFVLWVLLNLNVGTCVVQELSSAIRVYCTLALGKSIRTQFIMSTGVHVEIVLRT